MTLIQSLYRQAELAEAAYARFDLYGNRMSDGN
mgnify:CR=1 FL=1